MLVLLPYPCCVLQLACLRAFGSIWGAGRAKAEELYAAGFRTIEDIRKRGRDRLTRQQLVGLDRSDGGQCYSFGVIDVRT